jgi:hypothetical protein
VIRERAVPRRDGHTVEFPYTRQEQEALFRLAREEDVDRGGHDDARSAAMNLRRGFDVINAAIAKDDAGTCLHPLTMEGFSAEHLIALRHGA